MPRNRNQGSQPASAVGPMQEPTASAQRL